MPQLPESRQRLIHWPSVSRYDLACRGILQGLRVCTSACCTCDLSLSDLWLLHPRLPSGCQRGATSQFEAQSPSVVLHCFAVMTMQQALQACHACCGHSSITSDALPACSGIRWSQRCRHEHARHLHTSVQNRRANTSCRRPRSEHRQQRQSCHAPKHSAAPAPPCIA